MRGHGVLLTIEKVIVLKSVSIFAETPEEYLAEVAAVAEEENFLAGDEIIKMDDVGTSMYVIYEGKVRAHRGDKELGILEERSVFGELAALDPEPRSADITAIEDTHVLRLEGDAIYDLMAENIEVARGIIRALCRRVRKI
jgi:CRP-like cAMP-binding protein